MLEVPDLEHVVVERKELASALARQEAVGLVDRDPVQPGRKPRLASEARQRTPRAKEGLLGHVLCGACVPDHPHEEPVELRCLLSDKLVERGGVTVTGAGDEIVILGYG
jgi:hypothetical protein